MITSKQTNIHLCWLASTESILLWHGICPCKLRRASQLQKKSKFITTSICILLVSLCHSITVWRKKNPIQTSFRDFGWNVQPIMRSNWLGRNRKIGKAHQDNFSLNISYIYLIFISIYIYIQEQTRIRWPLTKEIRKLMNRPPLKP